MSKEFRQLPDAEISAGRVNKMRAFKNAVAQPISAETHRRDSPFYHPEASVLVGGSAAKNVMNNDPLRVGSDFDLLVFNPRLHDMRTYIHFLDTLRVHNAWFAESTGEVPVVFTSASREEYARYAGMSYMEQSMGMYTDFGLRGVARSPLVPLNGELGDHIIPVHFLFYTSISNYAQREHPDLARRLLASTIPADPNQDKPELIAVDPMSKEVLGLDNARWMIERALAELVLNREVFPHDFLHRLFKSEILTALRTSVLNTVYPNAEGAGIEDVLHHLDRDFPRITGKQLHASFKPLLDIHRHDHLTTEHTDEDIVDPALRLTCLIDELMEECREEQGSRQDI